jgi:hypothetical protein
MRSCVITVLVLTLLTAAVGAYLWFASQAAPEDTMIGRMGKVMRPEPPEPAPRTPSDYLILEDHGGIPKAEALKAGLRGEAYAYLAAGEPIEMSPGIQPVESIKLRGRQYDFCYQYNTTPPEMQFIEFNLNGEWDELHFGFGFDDTHASDPEKRWAIEFSIQCDGETAFGPQQLMPVDKPVFAKVAVAGVQRVSFITRRIGRSNPFAPVLVDPFVIKTQKESPASPK